MGQSIEELFRQSAGMPSNGPLYLRLRRAIAEAIEAGLIAPGEALPSERELAASAQVSRVTVRKAVEDLVHEGVLVQRHGSGTFVAPKVTHVEQSLSSLTSFTDDMARRGMSTTAVWLDRGVYAPSPEETVVLGLSSGEQVSRIARLRVADGVPLAIERATLSTSILPDPSVVVSSLYAALEVTGNRPVRAIQRLAAMTLGEADAKLLDVPAGSAALRIERTSYLASGRIIECTRSIYRGDAYDFVAELRLQP